MTTGGLVFLAAFTARSRAYAQAMAEAGLAPDQVLLFGDSDNDTGGGETGSSGAICEGLFLPELGIPLVETCDEAGWTVQRCPAGDVNNPDLVKRLRDVQPRCVVYSGYGGQLVGSGVLGLGCDVLHLHAGWLPDFRGSTTVYYSWITEGRTAVTALFLDKDIDGGPIVARRHYPPPPPGIDVDLVYDSAIRADLLVRVLRDFAETCEWPRVEDNGSGTTYYVIHPVLKHLALLSNEAHL